MCVDMLYVYRGFAMYFFFMFSTILWSCMQNEKTHTSITPAEPVHGWHSEEHYHLKAPGFNPELRWLSYMLSLRVCGLPPRLATLNCHRWMSVWMHMQGALNWLPVWGEFSCLAPSVPETGSSLNHNQNAAITIYNLDIKPNWKLCLTQVCERGYSSF